MQKCQEVPERRIKCHRHQILSQKPIPAIDEWPKTRNNTEIRKPAVSPIVPTCALLVRFCISFYYRIMFVIFARQVATVIFSDP